jgi:hypothetical protein
MSKTEIFRKYQLAAWNAEIIGAARNKAAELNDKFPGDPSLEVSYQNAVTVEHMYAHEAFEAMKQLDEAV